MSWKETSSQKKTPEKIGENRINWRKKNDCLENPGIDPGTSHMLSERSTIWASPPAHCSLSTIPA